MREFSPHISIRTKLILVAAGTLILSIIATAFFVRELVYESILRNKRTTVDILTASLVHDIKYNFDATGEGNVDDVIAKYMTYYRLIRRVSFYGPDLKIEADSEAGHIGQGTTDRDIVASVTMAKPSLVVTRQDWKDLRLRSTSPVLLGSRVAGAVVMDVSISDIEHVLAAINRRIAIILACTVVLASAALYVLLRHIVLLPLSRLMTVTQKIAQGQYDVAVPDTGRDEMGELGRSFNQMTADLKRSKEELDRYNQDLERMVREATAELKKAYEDLRDAQSQMVLNEKMASLGVLISGVAHEINTPVGAILNVTRSVESTMTTLPRMLAEFHKNSEGSGDLMLRCLDELISASRESRKSSGYKEVRALEHALRSRGVARHAEKAATLAKLNFTELERVTPYIECFENESFFVLAEQIASVSQAISISVASSQKIAEIVRALKYYAYSDKERTDAIDINESIQTALILLRNHLKGRVTINTDLEQDVPLIPCTSEIHQVWTNLLNNAYDAIVEMGESHPGEIAIVTRRIDDRVRITVADNGVGIPKERLGSVFDPFFTTKDIGKGTGLGLSIVSGVIKKHNGTVRVESHRGRTVFEVDIPLTGCSEQASKPGEPETAAAAWGDRDD